MSSKIVLCDIEGTTTSISFVKENLFPYAAKNVDSFLDAKWDAVDTQEAVKMLRDQSVADKRDNVDGCVEIAAETEDKTKQIESLVANVKWQMEHDRKAGPLKNLQGLMWVEAYKEGAFKGQVYDDVAAAFEAWTKAGRKIYIYSSGSVAIQKVHFEYSEAGDLAKYLSGYFDTKVGAKQDKASYEAIWKEISEQDATLNVKDVLFLTDIPAEGKAAKEAGMEVVLLKRPGNKELTDDEASLYKVVESFADIPMEEAAAKRKIDEAAQDDEVKPPAKVAKIEEDQPKEDEQKTAEIPAVAAAANDETTAAAVAVTAKEDSESKTEDDTTKNADVPMEATDITTSESTTAAEKTDTGNDDKLNGGRKEEEAAEDKKIDGGEKPADDAEEKMEVDSTTNTPPAVTEKNAAPEAKDVDNVATEADQKVESSAATATTTTEKTETETIKGGSTEEVAKTGGESREAEKATVDETEKHSKTEEKTVPEEKVPMPEAKENGKTKTDEAASSTLEAPKPNDAEKPVNGGGATDKAESQTATTTTTNGSTNAADQPQKANGNDSAEAVATNGHQDHDSDKENDKSMEAKSEEVSTTSAAVTGSDEAAAAAKKCVALEAVAEPPIATPVPAAVEGES